MKKGWVGVIAGMLISGDAIADAEVTTWRERDFAMYPQYCRARLDSKSGALIPIWEKKLGQSSFLHVHHYCFGMKAVVLAYANYTDKNRRKGYARSIVSETEYFLHHAPEESPLRAEVLITQGRGFLLAEQFDEARERFEAALEINPKAVDGWAFLSDVYAAQGRKDEAIRVLRSADEAVGGHKKITIRIQDLGGGGPKVEK